jgi:hypothetical protein
MTPRVPIKYERNHTNNNKYVRLRIQLVDFRGFFFHQR